jgi:hypothetical protein
VGLAVELRRGGIEHARQRIGWQRGRGLDGAWLDASATRALEPELSAEVLGAAHFPGDAVVDNRLLVSPSPSPRSARARGSSPRRSTGSSSAAGG